MEGVKGRRGSKRKTEFLPLLMKTVAVVTKRHFRRKRKKRCHIPIKPTIGVTMHNTSRRLCGIERFTILAYSTLHRLNK